MLWISGALLLAIVTFVVFVENRGGHYPIYKASSFSHLKVPTESTASTSDPVVQISAGTLRGTNAGSAIAFRGVPYAKPPIGELRWQPPEPPLPWQGVREAVQPASACTQRTSGLTPFIAPLAHAYGSNFEQPPIKSSEDCLYLDVWIPEWPVKRALPVMVWLHGGSNTVGSGTQPAYDGVPLTRHGVLLVTLNYRLGVMGFFSHPELTAESPHHSSGNYGLLDQLAALTWVKQNIAQFGGDPDNVTLFGESAGAIDAGRLMTSPLAAGLFKRVISESGPAFESGQTLSQAEGFGSAVSALAPGTASTALTKLRALPATEVDALVLKAKEHFPADMTAATTDGWVLPMSPQQAFLTGSIQKVDLLIGLNGRELSAFRLSAAAAAKASGGQSNVPESAGLGKVSEAARLYFGIWTNPAIAFYFGRILLNRSTGLDKAANDLIAACPVGALASLTKASGQHVFVYRFDRSIPGKGEATLGAFHSLEVPYVFGSLRTQEWRWLPSTADDASLSDLLQTYWTNFARTSNPNTSGLPNWPAWSDEEKEFLVVNQDASVTAQRNFPPLFSSLKANELKKSFKDNE
ncbi:MAG TPA: carboxylesterase family protein [Steroidobacteraceae bacterium]|nr:carboxylesterase family protein [Steroidobacteraceae bacterium]